MAKVLRRPRFGAQPKKAPGFAVMIGKGVLVSLVVSLICVLFLSLASLGTENLLVENYMRYIMVAVTMSSIFIGSAYAAQRAGAAGLLIGMAVGGVYVLISLAIGLEMSTDAVSMLVLANKFVAGLAAGALGGLVGVNL
ncbi:MAG: TIGR04086 family membrane protein [Negativicutes bacterium]|nr:TIGR04086 family membrane protein [Negativicutes bacterium]